MTSALSPLPASPYPSLRRYTADSVAQPAHVYDLASPQSSSTQRHSDWVYLSMRPRPAPRSRSDTSPHPLSHQTTAPLDGTLSSRNTRYSMHNHDFFNRIVCRLPTISSSSYNRPRPLYYRHTHIIVASSHNPPLPHRHKNPHTTPPPSQKSPYVPHPYVRGLSYGCGTYGDYRWRVKRSINSPLRPKVVRTADWSERTSTMTKFSWGENLATWLNQGTVASWA
jgi:hypothetical protein